MFCSNCGSQNNDGARFCSKCGKDLLSANSENTNTGGVNQNQDGSFNGTGLKYIHVVGTDGITRNFQVKWLPEEFDKMNPAQIVSALTEIYGVIHELTILINKEKNLKNECNQLEYDNMMPMNTTKLVGYGIALLVSVILYTAVGGLTVFLLIGGLLCFLYTVITEASAKSMRRKPYKNRYDAACKELDAAKRLGNDYIDQNAVILRSADAILPDYYYDENALAHMISSLKNRRATSLGEAVNLFVADKNAMEQHQLMQNQIYATKVAAENARDAAASAASAASAADRAATSAYYNNLRNS